MEDNELEDIWRTLHPTISRYTWHSSTKPLIQCRRDFFLVSKDIKSRIMKCEIIPGFFSDHSGVVTDLDITDASRGKGFWKLNCSLLNEDKFCSIIRHCIRETQVNNKGCNPHTMWEVIKCRIRGIN